MRQKQKNIRLLILLVVLIAVSVSLWFINKPVKREKIQLAKLNLPDTSQIASIEMKKDGKAILLTETDSAWLVNGKFEADPGIIQALMNILEQVETRRTAAENEVETLSERLVNEGVLVRLLNKSDQVLKAFWAGGNANQTQSYFMPESKDEVFIVALPGNEGYVSGIFEIPEIDWKNRLIVSADWQTLDKISYTFPKNPEASFTIKNNTGLPEVINSPRMDSTVVFNLLDEYRYLQADNFLTEEEIMKLDNIESTGAFLRVEVFNKNREPVTIDFYENDSDSAFWLARVDKREWVRFSKKRLRNIIRPRRAVVGQNS
ncbi:MAG TPA: hypothetical protein DDY13_00545 [Cytophagales bacterium]|jgi:hypothetical protein|nr:hypothetical protein [Cytophagales bacterium]